MPRLTLVSDVSQHGLFQPLAATRGRLIASTAAITAACFGAGRWVAYYVMEQSASIGLNMALILGVMLLVLVTAYIQALLIGDLFFPGPWREQVVLGQKHDAENLHISVRDHSAEFTVALVLMFLTTGFLVEQSTGQFFKRYRRIGFAYTTMRNPLPEKRLIALQSMVNPMRSHLWNDPVMHEIILKSLDDPDLKVREQAMWNAGVMKIETTRPALLKTLRDAASPASSRAQSAVALAKLGDEKEAREATVTALRTAKTTDEQIGMLRALALMKARQAIPTITPFIHAKDEQVMVHALWALHTMGARKTRPIIKAELNKNPTGLKKCALIDALKLMPEEEDILWARREYLRQKKGEKCARIVWEERDGPRRTILFGDTHRVKLIKLIANSGHGHKHKIWFTRIMHDKTEEWHTREVAATVLKELKKAGH